MNRLTQKEQILEDLKNGWKITPIDALKEYGCFRLAAVIHDLRKEGYNIKTERINKQNKDGKYASYYLSGLSSIVPF
jgi:hypothetical protein